MSAYLLLSQPRAIFSIFANSIHLQCYVSWDDERRREEDAADRGHQGAFELNGNKHCWRYFGRIYCYELMAWSPGDEQISKRRTIASTNILAPQRYLSTSNGMEVYIVHR